VVVIAHRACPLNAPENSLAGIRAAAEFGADFVEIDVRRTLEGVPVLMHDWSPRRTTGLPGPVALYPYFVLRRARLQGDSERVPALAEALEMLPDGLGIAVEVKDASLAGPVLALIRRFKLEDRSMVLSYRESAVRHFARRAPEIETWLLRDDRDPEGLRRYLDLANRSNADAISTHWDAIGTDFVAEANQRGLKVYSMNRDLESVQEKARAGLAGVVTDYPREVRRLLEEAGLLEPAVAGRASAAGS